MTGYIQSRGRARHSSARFVVIAERNSEQAAKYVEYVEQEAEMKNLYASRPLDEVEIHEPELDDLPIYTTSVGAVLTHQAAIPTLAEFCQLIRFDAFTSLQKPVYSVVSVGEGRWKAELKLPKIKALGAVSVFLSDMMPSKKAAKQRVAFNVCILLHRAGALDDHLLPFREPVGASAKDADGRELNRIEIPTHVKVSLPNVFGNAFSGSSWLCVVELSANNWKHRLGLVSGSAAPADLAGNLFEENGGRIGIEVVQSKELVWEDSV